MATLTKPDVLAEAIAHLRATIRGPIHEPGDAGYDDARRLYNAMIDKHPRLIVIAADVADVITAVTFAREQALLLAVRGGGHNGPGLGSCDDGLLICLSQMNGVLVDTAAMTVQVEGGALLGDLDHTTQAFGSAVPGGIISTTGVGGLTLGGGIGHLTRKFGLAIDNLLEADMVLADGSFVTASPSQHADLFWAIRGGGGNYGIVTAFRFRLNRLASLIAGPMLWPQEKAGEILTWYRDFLPMQSDDLNGFFANMIVPPGPPFPEHLWNQTVCAIVWTYTGNPGEADAVFGPIRDRFGAPLVDWVGPIPHESLQSMFDALNPPGMQWYWKAHCLQEMDDEAVATIVDWGARVPTMNSLMHLYPIDGAAGRVAPDATAWNNRAARWAMVIVGANPDPADNPTTKAWARGFWDAMRPFAYGGAYVNFVMDDEADDPVRRIYGAHYDRLARIKRTYDPDNLFRVNQNIKPA